MRIFILLSIFFSCSLFTACANHESPNSEFGLPEIREDSQASSTSTPIITIQSPLPSPTKTPTPSIPATILPSKTPEIVSRFVYPGSEPPCGFKLPLLSTYGGPIVSELNPTPEDLAALEDILPVSFKPVIEYILENPDSVGLSAYKVGSQEDGAFLNADVPMPLASVIKIINLVAYAEGVGAGLIDPTATLFVEDLENFYLPGTDLRSHQRSINDLEDRGRIFGSPKAMLLEEVPGLMIEYSSNAATDYIHFFLGQDKIESAALSLQINSQTAPCPFIGQFLIMANQTRPTAATNQLLEYFTDNPDLYGREVMFLSEAFSEDDQFRQEAINWRNQTRQPSGQTQRAFVDEFNGKGSARDYADLMARIAQNGLSNGNSSYIARKYLEWPMQFPVNQELFSNLGSKNGSFPGVLTTTYYAYPLGESAPIVVTLFFRDLDSPTYRQWRIDQTHDEFARWLLYEPDAIPLLSKILVE